MPKRLSLASPPSAITFSVAEPIRTPTTKIEAVRTLENSTFLLYTTCGQTLIKLKFRQILCCLEESYFIHNPSFGSLMYHNLSQPCSICIFSLSSFVI